MAFDFHKDWERYFNIQYENSKKSIIPFIKHNMALGPNSRVLEIGCAEAGVLKAFTELGASCTGIELHSSRIERAKRFLVAEFESGQINFIVRDIYDINVDKDLPAKFDLIILKDVIEHIHNQDKFVSRLGDFLNPGGKVFFGFPPWYMPFGGHQQVCESRFLSKFPYFHLLPSVLYKWILQIFGEGEKKIVDLLEIKETGISISRFERIMKTNNFGILKRKLYLISPIYEYKFNLQPRTQFPFISSIPYLRDFLSTAVYYLVEKGESSSE